MADTQIIPHVPLSQRVELIATNVQQLTQQLNTWSSQVEAWSQQVEGTMRTTEGEKVNLFVWARAIDEALFQLEKKLGSLEKKDDEAQMSFESHRAHREEELAKQQESFRKETHELFKSTVEKVQEGVQLLIAEKHESFVQRMQASLKTNNDELQEALTNNHDNLCKYVQNSCKAVDEALKLEISGLHAKIMQQFQDDRQDTSNKIQEAVQRATDAVSEDVKKQSDERLARFKAEIRTEACPPVAPMFRSPIIPPTQPHTSARVMNVRWDRKLSKLAYKEVKSFVSLFRAYADASALSEQELKLLLLQSLEGDVFQFVSPMCEDADVAEILQRLILRVRPSQSTIVKKLLQMTQRSSESVWDYGARFQALSQELQAHSDSRIRDIFVEGLNNSWRMTARSLVLQATDISLTDLLSKMRELEGHDAADVMEIDQFQATYDHGLKEADVNFVTGSSSLRSLCDNVRAELARNGRFADILQEILIAHRRPRPRQWDQSNRWSRFQPRQAFQRRGPPTGTQFYGNCYNCGERGHSAKFCPHRQPRAVNHIPLNNCFDPLSEFIDEQPVDHEVRETKSVCSVRKASKQTPKPIATQESDAHEKVTVLQYRRNQASTSSLPKTSLHVAAYLSGRNKKEDVLIDTGAEVSLLPLSFCKRWGIDVKGMRKTVLEGFNETSSPVIGSVVLRTSVGSWTRNIEYLVTKDTSKIILGYPALQSFKLKIDCEHDMLVGNDGRVVCCHFVSEN